jgi:putative thioredoxin
MNFLGPDGQSAAPTTPAQPAPDGAAELVRDGTDQSFMTDVIEPSKQVPVLVDFWAPWCGPCRQLGPVIEKAVRAANGAVRLVKINIDENPGIAGQLRIQSIPAVIAFQNGQPVDGFMGALPESQIKDFIKRLSGDRDEEAVADLLARAEAALAQGDTGGAAQDFAAALQADPDNMAAVAGLARVQLAEGETGEAKAILDSVPEPKKTDPAIAGVRAAIELSGETEGAGDAAALQKQVAASPTAENRYELARALIASGDLQGAADQLLDSVAADRDWKEQAARRLLLKVFDAAGPSSDIAKAGRRRLSSILFS